MKDKLKYLVTFFAMCMTCMAACATIPMRGVVYDVGLKFGGKNLSVETFDSARVAYDMDIIRNILRCNTVRIEGESIERLTEATKIAHRLGLKVLFNPWKMEANPEETVNYMTEAAASAEKLRKEGIDLTFVAGCEYTLFCKGAFPGDSFDKRMLFLTTLAQDPEAAPDKIKEANGRLNSILADICKGVRKEFSGPVTYSSGTWENVDWGLFDIVGIDHYRGAETDDEYVGAIDRYRHGKPIIVMEFGCCAYKGAALRGGAGFAIFQGVDADGNAVYESGTTPERSETEQADYIERQLALLEHAGVDGACVYVFSYPIYPYTPGGIDYDMISYALVKSFPAGDPHWQRTPAWIPKEAFYRLGSVYTKMENRDPNR